jgi:hypothetical protein
MLPEMNDRTAWELASEKASAQHGLVTRQQLTAVGIRRRTIDWWLEARRLRHAHRAVYWLGWASKQPIAWAMAAVLACRAFLSHFSAAALWSLREWGRVFEVTAPSQHRHPGILVHRSRVLPADELTVRRGVPVTTLARTVFDLAGALSNRPLTALVHQALVDHRGLGSQLARLLDRRPRQKGAAALREIPAITASGVPRSALEREFLAFCERDALPRPQINQLAAGCLVDALWPDARLIVELDSRRYHEDPIAFERDRARSNALIVGGYRVLRVTAKHLRDAPDALALTLRDMLGARAYPDRVRTPGCGAGGISTCACVRHPCPEWGIAP